jgi:Rhabdovirus nucleocapsid protein
MINRLSKTTVPSYLDQLVTRGDGQLRAAGSPSHITLFGVAGLYKTWENHVGYRKIIAAVDTFFYRFSDHA